MNLIYFNYSKASDCCNKLSDSYSELKKNNNELQTLLNDIGNYWKGSKKDQFVKEVQAYIDTYNSYINNIENCKYKLEKSSKSYSEFEDTYSNQL